MISLPLWPFYAFLRSENGATTYNTIIAALALMYQIRGFSTVPYVTQRLRLFRPQLEALWFQHLVRRHRAAGCDARPAFQRQFALDKGYNRFENKRVQSTPN